MTLKEINQLYRSDKGFTHDYLGFYESKFSDIRNNKLNVLEIGVLFGSSLKLWHEYFVNSNIYGVEDFSQKTGQEYYGHKPVIMEEVKKDLEKFERVILFNFNCEDVNSIKQNFGDIRFDVIIDDASHDSNQQKLNYLNFSQYLNDNGLYICEDVQSSNIAEDLKSLVLNTHPNKVVEVLEFNVQYRNDDRILFVR